ncbi:MAG: hypothetical protein WC333_00635 [Dehalococcoidia bacterium]|jgi:hypothetical protein
MAEIKFKICGDKPPFLIQVCKAVGACSYDYQKGIDYSGTCVTISSLLPNTSYCVKVTDQIGNVSGCTRSTPAHYIPDLATPKTIMLVGEGYMPSVKSCAYRNTCLCTSPNLQPGESYDVKLCLVTCNTNNTNNSVSFNCATCGGTNVSFGQYLNANNSCNPITYITKTVNYGDAITWSLSTSLQTSALEGSGYARIKVAGLTANTGTFTLSCAPVQSTYCKESNLNYVAPTTTAAPPTLGPAILCFKTLTNTMDPLDGDSGGIEWTRSSCLALDGYLSDAETFDVTINFIANTDTQNTLRAVYSCAYYYQGATKTTKATALSSSGTHIVSQNGSLVLNNITKSALSNYVFWSKSYVTVGSDLTHYFATKGCVCIHAVSGSEDVTRTTSTTKRTNETSYVSGAAPTTGGGTVPSIE